MNYKEEMKRFFLSNTIDVANKDIYIFGAGDSIQMYQTGLKRSKIWPNFKGYCTDIKQQIGMTLGGLRLLIWSQ